MLKLFSHNTIAQVLIIMATTLVLWLRAFVAPLEMVEPPLFAPLYKLLYGWLCGLPRLATALALLLVVGQAIWMNLLLHNNKTMHSASLLPTLLFVLCMSWESSRLTLTPVLLATVPLIAATSQLLTSGGTRLSTERNFGAAFFIGIATLCYLPTIAYLLPLVVILITYKMYRWRHFAVALLGLIAPWLLYLLCIFMNDTLPERLAMLAADMGSLDLRLQVQTFCPMLSTILFVVVLLVALMHTIGSASDNVNYMRINSRVLTVPLLASVVMALYAWLLPFDPQSAAIPFTYTVYVMLTTSRKRAWINETLFWILYVVAIL